MATYNVTGTVIVSPTVWASQGYGPVVNAAKLKAVIGYNSRAKVVQVVTKTSTVFQVTIQVSVDTPWYKLGFGSRTSRQEAAGRFLDAVNEFSIVQGIPTVKAA